MSNGWTSARSEPQDRRASRPDGSMTRASSRAWRLRRQRADAVPDRLDRENAGGYSALLTITTLDGEDRMILLDTDWNPIGWATLSPARASTECSRGEIDSWCCRTGSSITSGQLSDT